MEKTDAEVQEQRKIQQEKNGKKNVKPIHQPVLLIVKKDVFIVKWEDNKIHKAIVVNCLGQYQEYCARENYCGYPICLADMSDYGLHYSIAVLEPLSPHLRPFSEMTTFTKAVSSRGSSGK
jgi:hypothetical protein